MASARKAAAYSKRKVTPYTRISKKRQKSYIKTVPPQKIVRFKMGEGKNLHHQLIVISIEKVQIRDSALEACRQYLNKKMEEKLVNQYIFKVVPFPHHIQRENKMLTAPGADRMQTGMQLSFGKAMGKSAILKKDSEIFKISLATPKAVEFVRKLLKQIKSKLPSKTKVLYKKI